MNISTLTIIGLTQEACIMKFSFEFQDKFKIVGCIDIYRHRYVYVNIHILYI